jgi:hypothetical protein
MTIICEAPAMIEVLTCIVAKWFRLFDTCQPVAMCAEQHEVHATFHPT